MSWGSPSAASPQRVLRQPEDALGLAIGGLAIGDVCAVLEQVQSPHRTAARVAQVPAGVVPIAGPQEVGPSARRNRAPIRG
eukprot:4535191-Alexandrium_andersonii.AAC.1